MFIMISLIIEIILGILIVACLAQSIFSRGSKSDLFWGGAGACMLAAIITFMEGWWGAGIILCGIALFLALIAENDGEIETTSLILGTIAIISLIVAVITFSNGRWGYGIIFSAITILFVIILLIRILLYGAVAAAAIVVQAAVEDIKVIIYYIINRKTVKDEIRKKCPDALRSQIIKAEKNAAKVNFWDRYNKKHSMDISSDYGVDTDEIYEGAVIDLRA